MSEPQARSTYPALEAFRQVVRAHEAGDPLALARARRDLAQLGYVVTVRPVDRRPPRRGA